MIAVWALRPSGFGRTPMLIRPCGLPCHVEFKDSFKYQYFYLPPGCEEHAYIALTFYIAGTGLRSAELLSA